MKNPEHSKLHIAQEKPCKPSYCKPDKKPEPVNKYNYPERISIISQVFKIAT